MKNVKSFLPFLLLCLIISCTAPRSKESYLEKFGSFIKAVQSEHITYGEEGWKQSDLEFEKFTGEWYDKFSDEFSITDELTIKGYQAQYYLIKASDGTLDFFNEYLRDDYEKLREKVEFYMENNMEGDLEALMDNAEKAGDTAVAVINRIIRDVNENQ